MTRRHTDEPVWTWSCDRCGRTSGHLAHDQSDLPTFDAMRADGWHIAKTFGDLCPVCNREDAR